MRRVGAALMLALLAPLPVRAAPAALLDAPPGASSCSGCHALRTSSDVPVIAGRPAAEIEAALAAFRTGGRPATIMNRIAPGFSAEESHAIAEWLSRQPPP